MTMRQDKAIAKQNGQAMTEFAVVAAFVLVPLFLLIPLLGKYIDINHKTIQAARYEAWEYTAWNSNTSNPRFRGFTKTIPSKSFSDTKLEATNRFYTDPSALLESTDKSQAWQNSRINPLWYDHKGDSLIDSINNNNRVSEQATPDVTGLVSGLLNAVGTVADYISRALSFLGIPVGFTQIDADGNFQSATRVKLASVDWADPNNDLGADSFVDGLSFSHKAAVMSLAWSAGGKDHAKYQVGGLIPTSLLRFPPLDTARDVISTILLSPELHSKWLEFGYVDDDAVPQDRLIGQGNTVPGDVLCKGRFKYYRYENGNGEPTPGSYTGIFTPNNAIERVNYRENIVPRTLSRRLNKFNTCAGKL